MSTRVRRRRNKLLVVTVLACVGIWVAVVLNSAGSFDRFRKTYDVSVLLPDAASLAPGSSVRVGGVRVGNVRSVERRGTGALVGVQLTDRSVTPLPTDTRVALRLRTLVGENYVQLQPGRARTTLPEGGILGMRQARDYVQVDEILSTLRGGTRERAKAMIGGLGTGVGGRGAKLNRIVGGATDVLDEGVELFEPLQRDRRSVALLVDRLGDVMRAVGDREATLRSLARNTTTTFTAIADRDAAMDRTLAELPSTVRQIGATSRTLTSSSGQTAPVLSELAGALRAATPAVRMLRPAAQTGRALVREIDRAAPALRTVLRDGRRVAGPLVEGLPALHRALCQVNPILRKVTPYAPELLSTITGLASAVNYYDATGHAARIYALVGANSAVAYGEQFARATSTLLNAGLVSKVAQLGYDPFPEQGRVGLPATVGRTASGPATAGNQYPRIQADC